MDELLFQDRIEDSFSLEVHDSLWSPRYSEINVTVLVVECQVQEYTGRTFQRELGGISFAVTIQRNRRRFGPFVDDDTSH